MIKAKSFDCLEMKQAGARALLQKLEGMSPEEETAYWQKEEARFEAEIQTAKAKAEPENTDEFLTRLQSLIEAFEKESGE